ncbi:Glycine cleavage system H protein [Mycena kentingensis (nom. inval.)]|nr:Glycine cleavage system H protein [Mycena kentingensis (nom. inval.)]
MYSSILRTTRPATLFRARPRVFQSLQISRTLVTKRFTKEHEVVEYDNATGLGTIRITNHAQEALGDVVFVELPAVGAEVESGGQLGAVESVKAASDIYVPVSGVVEEVNETLASQPGILNKDPDGEGWLCRIKLSAPDELNALLTEDQYKEVLENEH